ncbi:MAG: hypothetical protein VX725_01530 [Actinomycetota bacterium]|nr:hypothetical protein [Actinomycetota bacterium]
MQKKENKELDVAIELFNSELEKLRDEKKVQDIVRKAEREKASAVQELKEAESNPELSDEEKEAAKNRWIEADKNLKQLLAGENEAETETRDGDSDPPDIIDEPDVLGCGVSLEDMQETAKEDGQDSDPEVIEDASDDAGDIPDTEQEPS